MKTITKISGQQLKKDLQATKTKLDNLESKVEKKFDLIISNYQQYLTDEDKMTLVKLSISDLSLEFKLGIIIRTEANYVKVNGNQVEIFS